MAKKRKNDPNRFKTSKPQGLFSFDPIRRNVFIWGLVAGAVGGFFIIQQQVIWQIAGVLSSVFIANYHITQAARRIPRWQAAVISFIGMALAMFTLIIVGSLIIAARLGGG